MKTDIKALALAHANAAIDVLAEIMSNPKAPAAARISAAKAILDRGFGKPATEKPEPESRELPVVRIERVIIDPNEPGVDPDNWTYREYYEPANDQLPSDEHDQQDQDQTQPAPPDVDDFDDYSMTSQSKWG